MSTTRRPTTDEAFTRRTGYVLVELGKAAWALADEALAPLDISAKHLRVLTLAASAPLSQQQLVAASGIDRTTMVALVDDLERRGLVTRRRDPEDRRRYVVTPTDATKSVIRRADRAISKAEARLLDGLEPAERAQLHELAARVLRVAQVGGPQPCDPEHEDLRHRDPRAHDPRVRE